MDLVYCGAVEGVGGVWDEEKKSWDLSDQEKVELGAVFARVDRDKDGKVSFDEVFEFLKGKLAEEGQGGEGESSRTEAEGKDEGKDETKDEGKK